jgi:ubiquitin thioesterase OTU1
MPSDNSCLFTAFGGALQDQPPAAVMRQKIADYIHAHPDEYTEAILGMPPLEYCTKITSPHYWGGAIEISIFSNIFDVEICTYDVKVGWRRCSGRSPFFLFFFSFSISRHANLRPPHQEKNLMRFGEHKSARCILVYSGIHYDRVAFSPSEPPYRVSLLPPEIDRTLWDTTDDAILAQTHRLVEKLHEIHYYTDPSEILLRCDHPGCDWIGSGESMGQRHARETGHHSLSEIDDTQDDKDGGMILRCQHAGCDWLGGIQAAKTHATDTGHTKTAIIPDF